ncbi:MAG: Rieske 2Fe-2S domain-containing protein [Gammaproteobacteria bacterium]|nr:Rieske 2Fe-2S domain-containing protein [Gammaproteobacteria bacterium]
MDKTIPKGWYFCAESSEIKPGKIVAKILFGQKIIIWRTTSGTIHISLAVCPHLGSDLGKLGTVQGEYLQCFSHSYTYNGQGDCVSTGFNTLPSCHKNVLKNFPVQEMNGFILVWYAEDNSSPDWYIPSELMQPNHSYVRSNFIFKVPIETINEDNFDVGHLYKWHNIYDVQTTPIEQNNHTISISHSFKRHSILFNKPFKPPFHFLTKGIHSRYSSTLYGHGLTDSYIDIFNLDIHLQDLIWCTPIDAEHTMYTTFVRLMKNSDKFYFLSNILSRIIFHACVWRLRREHKKEGHLFWENQSRIQSPILTDVESKLIGPYRRWCLQFTKKVDAT